MYGLDIIFWATLPLDGCKYLRVTKNMFCLYNTQKTLQILFKDKPSNVMSISEIINDDTANYNINHKPCMKTVFAITIRHYRVKLAFKTSYSY